MSRLSRVHQQRLHYLGAHPPQFLSEEALDGIAVRADRDDDLRQDRAERRQDAVPALWFGRALEAHDTKLYTQPMLPLVGRQVVPVDREIPAWATDWRWSELQQFAEPVVVDAQTMASIPMVGVAATEYVAKMRAYALAWGWSSDDIEAAARQGTPLSTTLAGLARDALERRIDQTLLLGDVNTGAVGFLKMPGVPILVPSTKTGGGTAWSATATGLEIVADILAGCNAVATAMGVTVPVVIQMDLAHELRLDQPMTSSNQDLTIRGYLAKNYPGRISRIVSSPRCATAGAGGVPRIMFSPAFSSETEALRHVFGMIPREFTAMAGEWVSGGLFYKQAAVVKCGGVACRNPSMFAYMDSV